mmetsp:Transcript_11015/g.15516  ORF Transcript_11015/g.15516 Transcript_11015/m.15516 type:complete len:943 (-) Transcript_11015:103-2931(-)
MKFRSLALTIAICHACTTTHAFVPTKRTTSPTFSVTKSSSSASSSSFSQLFAFPAPTDAELFKASTQRLLDNINGINSNLESTETKVLSTVLQDVKDVDVTIVSSLDQMGSTITKLLLDLIDKQPNRDEFMELYNKVQSTVQDVLPQSLTTNAGDIPAPLLVLGSALASYTIISSLLSLNNPPPSTRPYPLGKYDPVTARAYFDQRLDRVIQRGLEIAINSLTFGVGLLSDYASDKLKENAEQRALELSTLLTKLGPTFIKIGQSLSIRTDLLSPAYVRGLQTLQDQVPPFNTAEAKEILKDEWGVSNLDNVLQELSPEPVAAASLGQVYKGTLLDGTEVAIKVQRPNIMEQIALDMHFLREIAPIAKRTFNLNTDTTGTVDAWGLGFVDELDYLSEAKNAQIFMEKIQKTPLADVVFAPPVVEEYSTAKVLTTEWVDGERLDKSSQDDVTVLCSIAMNTYLTMMLEIGVLHCDPHPGNLLRTVDGRLCILDWGMVTRLDSNLQLTLIEHMAHLTSADYAEIPRDLLMLGFIPQDKADLIQDSGVVETLADIYGAWTKGGGAAAINVNKVIDQMQDLTATRGNLFQIPPYFAYIAKSFSVLEGIGLSNDEKYSIINECLPYVSKRLLTDQSDRTGGALSTFIFGPDKGNLDTRIIDYDRVEQLVTGFGSYTTSASGALLGKEDLTRTQMLEATADQILDLLVTEEETPLQSIVIEQLAKIIAASSRSIWTDLRERSGTLPSGRTVLGTLVDPLGVWRTSPIVRMNELDIKTVETTRNLITLLQDQVQTTTGSADEKSVGVGNDVFDLSTLTPEETLELSSILVNKVWERRIGVVKTSNRLAQQLLKLTADILERGDRIKLPAEKESTAATSSTTSTGTPLLESRTTATKKVVNGGSSERLMGARQLLEELETTDSPLLTVIAQEEPEEAKEPAVPMPVRSEF